MSVGDKHAISAVTCRIWKTHSQKADAVWKIFVRQSKDHKIEWKLPFSVLQNEEHIRLIWKVIKISIIL